jgi:hypothetical protein
MQYALLIYSEESSNDAERVGMLQEYAKLTGDLRDANRFLAGEELQPTGTATTVQMRDGDAIVSDGPFAETKEALGGFYLIEADSLDEAIEWAGRIPSARSGTIEVRPVVDRSGNGA